MVADNDIPESVRDARWEADFQPNPYYPSQILNTQPSGRRLLRQEIWIREKRLGHGGFGVVWLERAHSNNQFSAGLRAVKELRLGREDDRRRECIRELEALIKFSQRKFVDSFVEFYSWFESEDALFIATEYCQHGDLKQFVKNHGPIPELQVQKITDQVLQGINHMHDNKFAHRDLKPANILIKKRAPNDEWHVKICDMGLSKRIGTEITSTTVKGTPGFVAPERIPGIGANPSTADPFPCDMWCLGEVAFFLLTSGTTFENYWELQCYVKGTQNFPQQRLDEVGVSETAIDFIRLLMAVSPAERLSANQADYHLWMTCFNDTPGVQLGTDFDRSPGPSRSTVPNLEKYNERRERRLRTSTDEATIQHDKTLPPEDITEEIPTIPSGSWNTTTKLENISSKSRYLGARTKRRGETGEAQRTAPEDAQDQRPPFPSYIPADTTSDFSDDARDGSSSPNDSIRDKPPFFKTVEILANKIEAREFPSLSSLENSRFKSSRKYARTMRQAIRYICESGVQNILGFTPDTSHRTDTNASLTSFNEDELVVSLPTNSDSEERDAPARGDEDSVSSPSATNVAKGTADTSPDDYFENYDMPPLAWPPRYISEELSDIDEDIEPYPVISSPGELAGLFNAEEDAFLSEGEESSLVDDNHPAKKAKRDTSVFSDHAVNQKTSGSSVCSPKVTRMLGSGEAATRYRQPTVEDAEETE